MVYVLLVNRKSICTSYRSIDLDVSLGRFILRAVAFVLNHRGSVFRVTSYELVFFSVFQSAASVAAPLDVAEVIPCRAD